MRFRFDYRKARFYLKYVVTAAAVVLVVILAIKNFPPLGANLTYELDLAEDDRYSNVKRNPLETSVFLSQGPEGQIFEIPGLNMQTDMVQFELKTPYESLESAEVEASFKGGARELLIGVQNPITQQYSYLPLQNRSLNSLGWDYVADGGVTLFQRTRRFDSVEDFLGSLPSMSKTSTSGEAIPIISTYYYDLEQPRSPDIDLSKVDRPMEIDHALRGGHSFYTYVGKRSPEFSFTVRDLNAYEGADQLQVIVYSGDRIVDSRILEDDGDVSSGAVVSPSRSVTYDFPDLEEGTYRFDLVCNNDLVITNIKSSQFYLVFDQQLFVADHELYLFLPSRGATIYTDATALSGETWHEEALQTVTSDGARLMEISQVGIPFVAELPPGLKQLEIEEGDILLKTQKGYFSFDRESFFDPRPIATVPYSELAFPSSVEYIVATYTFPEKEDRVFTARQTIPLEGIPVPNNLVGFSLYAPQLVKSKKALELYSLGITIRKPGY